MDDEINLAWAVQVDEALLGARLESWFRTKAAITTLERCAPHIQSLSATGVPAEVINIIGNELKDIMYREVVVAWLDAQRCWENRCNTEDHFRKREFRDYDEDYDDVWWELNERHKAIINRCLHKIGLAVSFNATKPLEFNSSNRELGNEVQISQDSNGTSLASHVVSRLTD